MITIGLTGGIGSGKSTVSFMLKEAGFEIIDADIIARGVLKKYPEILERVKVEFGAGFFDWRGEFRRKEFGNHIFRFPKQRVRARDGMIREEAINRINSQMPLERKKDFANIIIENNDILPKTKEQVDLLIDFLNSNLK